ncbi:histone-lysine N-methyltransferase SETMAR-like [Vespa mandarinia]|uniref:histone-lysine N-methyltransferase SETMAR-like n=1 Tax=Vespa mandarinia TaxID=7446 RepID=UPI00160E2E71|nr:histone-lysine N-methyltransferase SETMAR-like [Vespa mandarinia]
MNSTDIHVIFLYEYKFGNNAAKAVRNINQAFGENIVNDRKVQRWFEKFRSGDFSLQNEPRGRPEKSLKNDALKALVETNPIVSSRELSARMEVDHETILRHLSEICMVKKMDKWIPHELTERNKLDHLNVCLSLLTRFNRDPFFDRIITCDEKWVLYDNRKRCARWHDRDEACVHIPRLSLHPRKILITVWWNVTGKIHYSFLRTEMTITAEKYCQYIEEMHEKLKIIRPSLVNRHGPILLHDNARSQTSYKTIAKFNELKYEIFQHPPYSPDLSPIDFHLFKHLELFLRAKQYENEDSVKNAISEFIDSKDQNFFKTGIYALKSRWEKCI